MKRKIIFTFVLLALFLISICIYININYDAVDVTHRPQDLSMPDGKLTHYDILVYSQKYMWAKTLNELCYTLAIAIIVYFCIEYSLNNYDKLQQKKDQDINYKKIQDLHSQINTNVFEGVLKKLIPIPLFDAITNDVLNQRIIRQNVVWEYTIEDKGEYYQLSQLISFDFSNIGNLKETIPLKISLQQTSLNKSWFELFKVAKHDGTIIMSEKKEDIEKKSVQFGNAFIHEQNIDIEGKQILKVTHKTINKYSSKHIQDFHFSNYSIIDLSIRVNKPSDCNFTAIGTFSEKLIKERDDPDTIIYRKINALLKGQALIFFIEPQLVTK
jgi:hypothetical protein